MAQPQFEHIKPNPGNSFFVGHYRGFHVCECSFWHIHPEYEIVYVKNGKGLRQIGNHSSYYTNGDLLLIGPGIPHSAFGNNDYPDNEVVVVQMPIEFVEGELFKMEETKSIFHLFERSKLVINWPSETREKIGKLLVILESAPPFERLIRMLEILKHLAEVENYSTLLKSDLSLDIYSNDYNRISAIYKFVSENYGRFIALEEVSNLTGLTPNSFCRFFKRVTCRTFTGYLNEYRIYKATEIMAIRNSSITEIMIDCGFNELTHFSRQFKKVMGESPRMYRNRVREWYTDQV